MKRLKVLVACEYSGIVRDAFLECGHYAMSCDLLPTESPKGSTASILCADGKMHSLITHYQGNILEVLNNPDEFCNWDLMIAHPPCTRLANAGVRWLHKPPKGRTLEDVWLELEQACEFYRVIRDADIPHKCVENPIMHKYARERISVGYRQVVQPHHFGDPQFKAVGLELINLPDLIPTNKLKVPKAGTAKHSQWSRVHLMSPGPNRAKERSRFFPGIAAAMAQQWSNL